MTVIVPMETMRKATEKLLGHLTAPSHHRLGSLDRDHDNVRTEGTEGLVKIDAAFKLVSEFYSAGIRSLGIRKRDPLFRRKPFSKPFWLFFGT